MAPNLVVVKFETLPSTIENAFAKLNTRFMVRGRPVHPGLIERFERWQSDSVEPVVISVDALAAAGSNEYLDGSVTTESNGHITLTKEPGEGYFRYAWLGTVAPSFGITWTRYSHFVVRREAAHEVTRLDAGAVLVGFRLRRGLRRKS